MGGAHRRLSPHPRLIRAALESVAPRMAKMRDERRPEQARHYPIVMSAACHGVAI